MHARALHTLSLLTAMLLALACGGGGGGVDEDTGVSWPDTSQDTGGGDSLPWDGGGTDTTPCSSTCTDEWAKVCEAGGVKTCEDPDDDGCFTWSSIQVCQPGTTCEQGACATDCSAQDCTVAGATRCADATTVETCNDYNADGCLEWGGGSPCTGGMVCSGGHCAISCEDDCTVVGATKCDGNQIVTCNEHDGDGCLEWGQPQDCGELLCSSGHCSATCQDECTVIGASQCDGGGTKSCGNHDSDDCLEWGTVVPCEQGEVCSSGFCVSTCSDECTVDGATKCVVNSVVTCGDYNSDGCMEWGSTVGCDEGMVCASGACGWTCEDECTVDGATQCDGDLVVTCGDSDPDDCLEWGTGLGCDDGLVCSGGDCVAQCEDDCPAGGVVECVAGTTAQHHGCADHDGDGCLEWGTPETCAGGLVCSGGDCVASCSNTCDADGAKACEGDAVKACGDYNEDGCLEWGTPDPCEGFEACVDGACQQQQAAAVVINELLYDGDGADADSFVELKGPAGAALTGYTLVGVNGLDGDIYRTVALAGAIGADGLFVVIMSSADAAVVAASDQVDDDVDFQNSPDSVQLRFGAQVVDAVGYGDFTGQVFGGEGSPAPDVAAGGHSLGRNEAGADTDDNAADFIDYAVPTPNAPNVQLDPCAGVSCDVVPEATCDDDERVVYSAPGQCVDGDCVFGSEETVCEHGCADGECLAAGELSVGWCKLQWPHELELAGGDMEFVYGRVYVEGVTDQTPNANDAHAMVKGQVGVGPDGGDPTAAGWTWVDGETNGAADGAEGDNDEYIAILEAPATAGAYDFAFRFSADGGQTWTVCDKDDNANGYSAAQAGALTVTGGGGCTIGEACETDGFCNSFGKCVKVNQWIALPAGAFTMGAPGDEGGYMPNEAQHEVTLSRGFEMMSSEVDAETFYVLTDYLPDAFTDCLGEEGCPLNGITWHEAAAYCNVLSFLEDHAECYDCAGDMPDVTCALDAAYATPYDCPGYRMPTAAEWEYAARAGTTTPTYYNAEFPTLGCQYNWVLAEIAWFCNNSDGVPWPWGWLTPNAWGFYDILGNVAEWCHDAFVDAALPDDTDPWGEGGGSEREVRGGGWDSSAAETRAAERWSEEPTFRGAIGLRPVRTLF
jgi:formylglycine-generating enzyme required for sulfatase activity